MADDPRIYLVLDVTGTIRQVKVADSPTLKGGKEVIPFKIPNATIVSAPVPDTEELENLERLLDANQKVAFEKSIEAEATKASLSSVKTVANIKTLAEEPKRVQTYHAMGKCCSLVRGQNLEGFIQDHMKYTKGALVLKHVEPEALNA